MILDGREVPVPPGVLDPVAKIPEYKVCAVALEAVRP